MSLVLLMLILRDVVVVAMMIVIHLIELIRVFGIGTPVGDI